MTFAAGFGGGDSGSLVKAGSAALTLTGASTYTGVTKIAAGTLLLANGNALANSTLDYSDYGGSLSFGSLTAATVAAIEGSRQDLSLANESSQAVALTVGGNNASTTYSGVFSGGGSLTKTGSGTLTLSGANAYTGGTTSTPAHWLLPARSARQAPSPSAAMRCSSGWARTYKTCRAGW